jgi:hypothetical protein
MPESWPGYHLTFRYGRTEYRIAVENGGERFKQEIELVDDGQVHAIHINAGMASPETSRPKA